MPRTIDPPGQTSFLDFLIPTVLIRHGEQVYLVKLGKPIKWLTVK